MSTFKHTEDVRINYIFVMTIKKNKHIPVHKNCVILEKKNRTCLVGNKFKVFLFLKYMSELLRILITYFCPLYN